MFLFRWYQEMDKNGKVITGYQSKECKSFYLPLDNGGYGFEWVSNLQVICRPPEADPGQESNLHPLGSRQENGDRGYEKDAAALGCMF